jgi:hypothetical protein
MLDNLGTVVRKERCPGKFQELICMHSDYAYL